MQRHKKNNNILYVVLGTLCVFASAAFLGWWTKPNISAYDREWHLSGEGFIVNINANVTLPPTMPESIASTIQDEDTNQEPIDLTLPVSTDSQMPAEEVLATIIDSLDNHTPTPAKIESELRDERQSLRLSSIEPKPEKNESDTQTPTTPKSAFTTTVKNPYQKTD